MVCLFLFTIFLSFCSSEIYATTLFEDNFEDGIPDGWVVIGSPGWNVQNDEYGIFLNPGLSNTVPDDSLWNFNWTNISYEVDLRGEKGVDKNILVKFKDTSNFIELHANDRGIFLEKASSSGGAGILAFSTRLLTNHIAYHFRFEVKNNSNIKVYLDGSLLFDVNETSPVFTNWKIGLRAGTGGTPIVEVWFDNVVVSELEAEPTLTPLILLPGLGASWNTEGMIGGKTDIPPKQWQMTPFVKCYDGLIKSLENTGYKQGENFFVYNYDWRRPLDQAADQLKGFIDQNLSPPGTKIDLVGHSLGGLVARAYAQKYGTGKIDQLITLGSPHSGVLQPYLAWEGGQIGERETWQSVGLQLLLQINKTNFQTNVQIIREMVPSLKDILPIFNFLKKDSTEVDWQAQNQKNDYLNSLKTNVSQIFDQLLAIFGTSGDTPRWYQVENRNTIERLLGQWEDGKPTATKDENGDQTVLGASAQTSPDPAQSISLNHRDLVEQKQGIEKAFEALGLSTQAITEEPVFNRQKALIFLLASPAKLKVIDPEGGEFFSDEDGFVIINEPKQGNYRAEITPLNGGGDYRLYLGQLMKDEDLWSQIKEKVGPGETDVFQFEINSQSPLANPLIDTDGLYYLRLAKSRLTPLNLSSQTMNYLNSTISLAENHQYSQSKSQVERLINYLFTERKKATGVQTQEGIYLAVLDLVQAYIRLCQAGSLPFNQRMELKELRLTEQLLTIYRRGIEVLDGQGKATSNQASSFTKAEENLAKAQESYPARLPATHIYSIVSRYLLYETR